MYVISISEVCEMSTYSNRVLRGSIFCYTPPASHRIAINFSYQQLPQLSLIIIDEEIQRKFHRAKNPKLKVNSD